MANFLFCGCRQVSPQTISCCRHCKLSSELSLPQMQLSGPVRYSNTNLSLDHFKLEFNSSELVLTCPYHTLLLSSQQFADQSAMLHQFGRNTSDANFSNYRQGHRVLLHTTWLRVFKRQLKIISQPRTMIDACQSPSYRACCAGVFIKHCSFRRSI